MFFAGGWEGAEKTFLFYDLFAILRVPRYPAGWLVRG